MNFIIADNQEITQFAIEQLLAEYKGDQIYYAGNKSKLVSLLQAEEQSVIILDYSLFDFLDIENLLVVVQRFPRARWVLFSENLTDQFLRLVFYQTQNMSIVFKDASVKDFQEAVAAAVGGRRYLSQRAAETLLARQQRETERPAGLTPTEVEIVHAMAKGRSAKEIAAERNTSVNTVNTHRKNIFRKFGVNTAYEAVRMAIRSGLVDESEYLI